MLPISLNKHNGKLLDQAPKACCTRRQKQNPEYTLHAYVQMPNTGTNTTTVPNKLSQFKSNPLAERPASASA